MTTRRTNFLECGGSGAAWVVRWLIFALASWLSGCENGPSSVSSTKASSALVALPVPADAAAAEGAIRFLEARVKKDPDDFIALNKLAGYYQLKLRETGDQQWLDLARRTAQASLKAIPSEQNTSALSLLAQTEFAQHNFLAARGHALRLIELDGHKAYPYQILGDALLELGDYAGAEKAFGEMQRRGPGTYIAETRRGRMALLRGDNRQARELYTNALLLALETVPPQRETVAWTRWQLGELAFNTGDYATAEKYYRDALTTFPDYYRALAGLGRTLGARGDLHGAIDRYERATKILPDPAFVAALGDLYRLAGRKQEADRQFTLCEKIAALGASGGCPYNRALAIFYADHDLKPEEAYQLAKREYDVRRDLYGSDALAWAALKSGRTGEAQRSIQDALRLGTQDARLFYHAGMIARAAGDHAASRNYLQRALQLNPQFDLHQAQLARDALTE